MSQQGFNQKNHFQCYIRNIKGKTFIFWSNSLCLCSVSEAGYCRKMGLPENLLCLQYEGRVLQDSNLLKDYGISRNSSIILTSRLCGGVQGARISSGKMSSFKEVVQGKSSSTIESSQGFRFDECCSLEQCLLP